MDFGANFQQARKEKGITQQALSKVTGYDTRMISRWEGGNTKPNIEAAVKLAKALGASLDVLTGLKEGHKADKPFDPELELLLQQAANLPKNEIAALKMVVRKFLG